MRVGAAQVAEQRQFRGAGSGLRDGHADRDDGVGAEPGLVRRAVQVDHRLVNKPLIVRVVPQQRRLDLFDDPLDRLGDRLAAVLVVPVAPLDRLERAGRGAAGGRRPAQRAVIKDHLGLKGRVAPGVQDLPGEDRFDGSHG